MRPFQSLVLVKLLSDRTARPSVALADPRDSARLGIALAGVEFKDDPESVTLVSAERYSASPPAEVIDAGAIFATISESGQLYCADASDPEGRPCEPPPEPLESA